MQNRMLLIGEAERAAIKNLMFYAENNKISYKKMKKIMSGKLPPAGDNPNFSIVIPLDYRIVFTIERQPLWWAKHLSISVPEKGKYPSVEAVDMICQEFGIDNFNRIGWSGKVYYEEEIEAVNIVSKI
ncbi:MAG: hypothetical protein KJN62_06545 [Deltaproteobacteria bacterium]|nr:hypothetical protein [Deltaproteobacteria bacterium]